MLAVVAVPDRMLKDWTRKIAGFANVDGKAFLLTYRDRPDWCTGPKCNELDLTARHTTQNCDTAIKKRQRENLYKVSDPEEASRQFNRCLATVTKTIYAKDKLTFNCFTAYAQSVEGRWRSLAETNGIFPDRVNDCAASFAAAFPSIYSAEIKHNWFRSPQDFIQWCLQNFSDGYLLEKVLELLRNVSEQAGDSESAETIKTYDELKMAHLFSETAHAIVNSYEKGSKTLVPTGIDKFIAKIWEVCNLPDYPELTGDTGSNRKKMAGLTLVALYEKTYKPVPPEKPTSAPTRQSEATTKPTTAPVTTPVPTPVSAGSKEQQVATDESITNSNKPTTGLTTESDRKEESDTSMDESDEYEDDEEGFTDADQLMIDDNGLPTTKKARSSTTQKKALPAGGDPLGPSGRGISKRNAPAPLLNENNKRAAIR